MKYKSLDSRLLNLSVFFDLFKFNSSIGKVAILFLINSLLLSVSNHSLAQINFKERFKDGKVMTLQGFPIEKFGIVWDSTIDVYNFHVWNYPQVSSLYEYDKSLYYVNDLDKLIEELFRKLDYNEVIDVTFKRKILQRRGCHPLEVNLMDSDFLHWYSSDKKFKMIIDEMNFLQEDDDFKLLQPNAKLLIEEESEQFKNIIDIQREIQNLDSFKKMLVAYFYLLDSFYFDWSENVFNSDIDAFYSIIEMLVDETQSEKPWNSDFHSLNPESNDNCLSFNTMSSTYYKYNLCWEYKYIGRDDWYSFMNKYRELQIENPLLEFRMNHTSIEIDKNKEYEKQFILAKAIEFLADYFNKKGEEPKVLEYYYKSLNIFSKTRYYFEQGKLEEKIADFLSSSRIENVEFNNKFCLIHYRSAREKYRITGEYFHEDQVKFKECLVNINTLSGNKELEEFLKLSISGLIDDWDNKLLCQNQYYLYTALGNYFRFKDDEDHNIRAMQYYQKSIIAAMRDLKKYNISELYDALDNLITINDLLGRKDLMKHYHQLKIEIISIVDNRIEEIEGSIMEKNGFIMDNQLRKWKTEFALPNTLWYNQPKGFVNSFIHIGSYSRNYFYKAESNYYKSLYKYEKNENFLQLANFYDDLIDQAFNSSMAEEIDKLNNLESFYSTSILKREYDNLSNELDSLKNEYQLLKKQNESLLEENKKKIFENIELNKINDRLSSDNSTLSYIQQKLKAVNDSILESNRLILRTNDSIMQANISIQEDIKIAIDAKEAAKNEKQNAEDARNWAIGIAVIISAFIIMSSIFYARRKARKANEKLIEAEIKVKQNLKIANDAKLEAEKSKNLAIAAGIELNKKIEEITKLNNQTVISNVRAAISQLFARTDSHDLGHVLDAYKSIEDFGAKEFESQYMPQGDIKSTSSEFDANGKPIIRTDRLRSKYGAHVINDNDNTEVLETKFEFYPNLIAYFNQYLKTRMDFRADVATGNANSLTTLDYYNDIFIPFDNNLIFTNRISGISDKDFHYKIENSYSYNIEKTLTNKDISLQVAIPNDVLGCHALYIIWSNVIRNTVKHSKMDSGEKNDLIINIQLQEYSLNPDYIELCIFTSIYRDDKEIAALVEKRNRAFDDEIFDKKESSRMRDNNLGSIEMAACAAYVRLLNVTDINEKKFKLYNPEGVFDNSPRGSKKEPVIIHAYANKDGANEGQSSLGYKLYLLKPKEILVVCDDPASLGNNLIEGGITAPILQKYGIEFIEASAIEKTYTHKFLVLVGNENDFEHFKNVCDDKKLSASLPKRKLFIENPKFKNIEQFKNACWEKWIDIYEEQFLIRDIDNEQEYRYPVDAIKYTKSIRLYDHHANLPVDNLSNGEYHEMCCGHHWLKRYRSRLDNPFYKLPYIEGVITKVLIIDERIQKSIVEHKKKYADVIPYDQYFLQQGIFIPGTNNNGPDLNVSNLKEKKQELKDYIIGFINNVDFVVLHLGLLEKFFNDEDEKGVEKLDELINDLIGGKKNRRKVVITTGRGKAVNVNPDLSFLPISLLQNAIETSFDKYRLVQILYNSRKSIF